MSGVMKDFVGTGRPFDEGAAQVASLLKRDKAELTGKVSIGAQAYEAFGEEVGEDKLANVEEFPDAFKPAAGLSMTFLMPCCAQSIWSPYTTSRHQKEH
jgi:hypothetical protein